MWIRYFYRWPSSARRTYLQSRPWRTSSLWRRTRIRGWMSGRKPRPWCRFSRLPSFRCLPYMYWGSCFIEGRRTIKKWTRQSSEGKGTICSKHSWWVRLVFSHRITLYVQYESCLPSAPKRKGKIYTLFMELCCQSPITNLQFPFKLFWTFLKN